MTGQGWRVELPAELVAKPHTGWAYEGGIIARGWLGEAPVTAIVQHRTLDRGFNDWVRGLGAMWLELDPVTRITVPGASDAARLSGIVEFDGLGAEDDRERCVMIVAKRGRRVWSLTIRSRPEDGVEDRVEAILASFEIVPEGAQSSKPESSSSASP